MEVYVDKVMWYHDIFPILKTLLLKIVIIKLNPLLLYYGKTVQDLAVSLHVADWEGNPTTNYKNYRLGERG